MPVLPPRHTRVDRYPAQRAAHTIRLTLVQTQFLERLAAGDVLSPLFLDSVAMHPRFFVSALGVILNIVGRHCVFELHTRLVFITKYRGAYVHYEHLRSLESIFRSVCADFETEIVEFNGETDCVHLLVNFSPKVSISELVNSLKGVEPEAQTDAP